MAFDCDERANIRYKESEADYKQKKQNEEKLLNFEKEMQQRDLLEEQEEEQRRKNESENKYDTMFKTLMDSKLTRKKNGRT